MRVIIVDDEPKIRQGIAKRLNQEPDTEIAGVFEGADEALHFLEEDAADVMITDICMPGKSGLDLIDEIRLRNQEIQIIIISGYSEFEYAQRAIELGVLRYLTKPTNPRRLIEAVDCARALIAAEAEQREPMDDEGEETGRSLLIREAIRYMEANYEKKLMLRDIAEHLHISPNYLCERFKKQVGQNISDYLTTLRMARAKQLLRDVNYRVSDIAWAVGFSDPKYFSSTFKKQVGMSPMEYRNGKH